MRSIVTGPFWSPDTFYRCKYAAVHDVCCRWTNIITRYVPPLKCTNPPSLLPFPHPLYVDTIRVARMLKFSATLGIYPLVSPSSSSRALLEYVSTSISTQSYWVLHWILFVKDHTTSTVSPVQTKMWGNLMPVNILFQSNCCGYAPLCESVCIPESTSIRQKPILDSVLL
jgi:hypothetical protein